MFLSGRAFIYHVQGRLKKKESETIIKKSD
jgi:hypothetical protein